jgi:hypothetical protein
MVGIAQKIAALADKNLVSPITRPARFSMTAGAIHLKNLHPGNQNLVGGLEWIPEASCLPRQGCL